MQSSLDTARAAAAARPPDIRLRVLEPNELVRLREPLWPCVHSAAGATWGRYTPEALWAMVERAELTPLVIWDAAGPEVLALLLVQIYETPGARVGEVCFAGALSGDTPMVPGGWAVAWRALVQLLGDAGCSQVQFAGRTGWGRVLGLQPTGSQFVQVLRRRGAEAIAHG